MTQSAQGVSRRPLSSVAGRLLARARREWGQQQFEAAEQSLINVLRLAPDEPDAVRLLGMVVQRLGRHAEASECFRRVLAMGPEDSDLRLGLGISLFELGEADEALTHFRQACKLEPASASAWFNLGEALGRQAHTQEALAALRRALELDPAHISARLSLARAHANLGEVATAVAEFREVLRRNLRQRRRMVRALESQCRPLRCRGLRFAAARFDREDSSHRDRELLGFTFAKALESQGDYAQAFEVFRTANASRRRRVKWDAAGEHRRVEAILRVFADAAPTPSDARLGNEAILIVSIPRSGSTLVEQILASHPEVEGANEIKDMKQVIDAETGRRNSAFPLWVPDATADDWQRLGREYLARTARWRRTRPRFTDKSLVTWYLVGAALAMLPAARVVVVRRDPVETCLGCFRQCFSEASGFACDLDEMADYCGDFLRLTRFWLEKYPSQVFDLQYEAWWPSRSP